MNPLGRAVVAAVLAVLVSAPTVLGAWKQGSTTCPPTKYVYVYSKASVEVYHYWSWQLSLLLQSVSTISGR
jgi:hypothetical protein